MDHFGLDMTFLGIKQVSIIIFVLKIIFLTNFYNFPIHWTTHQILESVGTGAQVFLDSGCWRQDGGFIRVNLRGSFKRLPGRRGIDNCGLLDPIPKARIRLLSHLCGVR
jgi:hypothetical protein